MKLLICLMFLVALDCSMAVKNRKRVSSRRESEPAKEETSLDGMMRNCAPDICRCPTPNSLPGDISFMSDNSTTGCLCSCGREEGTTCLNDGHCMIGTECVAPLDAVNNIDNSMGICASVCDNTKCPQYHNCKVSDEGKALCACDPFDCSEDVQIAVEAVRQRTGSERLFTNMCSMVNENCVLKDKDGDDNLWIRKDQRYSISS